jgi:hypothetical protein
MKGVRSRLALAAEFIFNAMQLRQRSRRAPVPDPVTAKLRADTYYAIIAHGIAQSSNNYEARQILYDHVRAAFASKLHGHDPAWITYERRALEMAISRFESRASVLDIISKKQPLETVVPFVGSYHGAMDTMAPPFQHATEDTFLTKPAH